MKVIITVTTTTTTNYSLIIETLILRIRKYNYHATCQ